MSRSPVLGRDLGGPPRLWLLLGDKAGDNAQVLELARALGEPFAIKRLVPRPEWMLGKPRFRPSLAHLDPARSDPLEPPWPELAITIGRRPSMAALWLAERSGGRTRLVILGRPKRWPERFALIIAPAQYAVPEAPNVVRLQLPLLRPDPERLAAARERWRPRLEPLPRPLTAFFVGGETKPYRFDAAVARELAARLSSMREGGTIYASTSRRTSAEVARALREALPPGTLFYSWRAEDPPEANPYYGLLAFADRFVVTGDSVSMVVEVARLGRPLAIAELPVRRDLATRVGRGVARALGPDGALAGLGALVRRAGLLGFSREIERIHRYLFASGRAVRLGEPFPTAATPPADELEVAVARVRALLAPAVPPPADEPAPLVS
ncbi:MAG: ELM1/GtrOC1 family putative glycosyltransferase [Geminicoccaceae bacterium]|nr:ELM1/GtrOC1 family putative glycosyltransferase [Geminicoccaceae bacterium]